MEVQKEAQRIMTMSVWKMYHSRMQRGGLRLHRSLQLSLVMRNARDLYLSAKLEEEDEMGGGSAPPPTPQPCGSLDPEPMETQEEPGSSLPAHSLTQTAWSRGASGPLLVSRKPSRKRRSSSLGKIGAAEAGLVPSKKAKLAEEEGERQPQRQEGPFPSLARILQDRFSSLILQPPPAKGAEEPKANCRQGDGVLSIMVRAVVAF
uniref:Immediate early response 2 n=1 Tax=Naja naja TaxID=35670 RepID=A0A8C6VEN2_NAJNA